MSKYKSFELKKDVLYYSAAERDDEKMFFVIKINQIDEEALIVTLFLRVFDHNNVLKFIGTLFNVETTLAQLDEKLHSPVIFRLASKKEKRLFNKIMNINYQ